MDHARLDGSRTRFAQEEGAAMLVVATQNMTLRQGMVSTVNMLKSEALVA
jgi:4-hydroxy-2-oxoheptanedioate aldolase